MKLRYNIFLAFILPLGLSVVQIYGKELSDIEVAENSGEYSAAQNLENVVDDLNAVDLEGNTELMYASLEGDIELVRYLLKNGIDPNIQNVYGQSSLIYFSLYGYNPSILIVNTLVENNANLDVKDYNGLNAISYSAYNLQEDLVIRMVELGAKEIDAVALLRLSKLAIKNNNIKLFKLLLPYGLKSEKYQYFIFSFIIERNDPSLCELLINAGYDVNAIQDGSLSLLQEALKQRGKTNIELLLENGADIHYQNHSGDSVLMTAVYFNQDNIVANILKQGADPNIPRKDGITILMTAVKNGNRKITELLLNHGADLLAMDNHGKTALDYAKNNGSPELLLLLQNYLNK